MCTFYFTRNKRSYIVDIIRKQFIHYILVCLLNVNESTIKRWDKYLSCFVYFIVTIQNRNEPILHLYDLGRTTNHLILYSIAWIWNAVQKNTKCWMLCDCGLVSNCWDFFHFLPELPFLSPFPRQNIAWKFMHQQIFVRFSFFKWDFIFIFIT